MAPANGPERTFQHLDHDKDGVITGADFEKTAHTVVQRFGLSPSAPKAQNLIRGYQQAWELIRADLDIDRDGTVNPAEFIEATERLGAGRAFADNLVVVSEAEFDAADTNDDGLLTREEFSTLVRALGHVEGDVNAAFEAIDDNHDGKVTKGEYVNAVREFFVNGPNSPRGRIFAGL